MLRKHVNVLVMNQQVRTLYGSGTVAHTRNEWRQVRSAG